MASCAPAEIVLSNATDVKVVPAPDLLTEGPKESDNVPDDSPDIVCFADDDSEHPHNWPAVRKWPIVTTVALMNMIGIFATTAIVPAAPQIIAALHVHRLVYRTLLVSIWELGEGIGPFLYAPLSERFGRLPVYHIGNLLGLLCAIASALSTNISMLVAFRFLNGCVLTALGLSPTIVSDMFRAEERGMALAIESGLQLTGTFIAPLCGAFIAQALGWRWTIWVVAISIGSVGAISLVVVRETYEVKILERKAARLRRETSNSHLRPEHQTTFNTKAVLTSFTRPLKLLATSPRVFVTAIYNAFAYALSYLILTTLTEIMEANYGFNHGTVGLAFLAPAIGYAAGMAFYGLTSDRYITYMKKKDEGVMKPERRLMHMLLSSVILPPSLVLYGWTLAFRVQYFVPLVASAIVGSCMMMSILAMSNYMADAFGIYSASAIAVGVILRALFGATLPLAGPALYRNLGLGWGNSLLAFISMDFVPPLWYLIHSR